MTVKFLKYEANPAPEHERKFEGIATVSMPVTLFGIETQLILNYRIQKGKDGKGTFSSPFAMKLGEEWIDGHCVDSSYADKEMRALILKGISNGSRSIPCAAPVQTFVQATFDDSNVPF